MYLKPASQICSHVRYASVASTVALLLSSCIAQSAEQKSPPLFDIHGLSAPEINTVIGVLNHDATVLNDLAKRIQLDAQAQQDARDAAEKKK